MSVLLGLAMAWGAPQLALVETAPVETSLDEPAFADTHTVWLQMVQGATERIDLSHFYVFDRPPSRLTPVVEALRERAAKGVAVRFLADAKFQKTYPDLLAELGALDNVEVRLLDLGPLTGGVQHAKYMLVDGRELYLGSANFDWRSLEHIQELGIRTDEPATVASLQAVFDDDWQRANGETPAWRDVPVDASPVAYGEHQVLVTPVASPRDLLPNQALWDWPRLAFVLDHAQTSVRLQLMSYAIKGYSGDSWDGLDQALRRAAARGVQVELLVADWSKASPKVEALQDLARVDNITVKFASLPEHSGGFIDFARVVHSKFLVVDGRTSWVGTSNGAGDYFFASRNVGVFVEGEAFATDLDRFFGRTWDSELVEVVDPEASYTPPKRKN